MFVNSVREDPGFHRMNRIFLLQIRAQYSIRGTESSKNRLFQLYSVRSYFCYFSVVHLVDWYLPTSSEFRNPVYQFLLHIVFLINWIESIEKGLSRILVEINLTAFFFHLHYTWSHITHTRIQWWMDENVSCRKTLRRSAVYSIRISFKSIILFMNMTLFDSLCF